MKTTNKTQKVKEYKVVFFADGSEIGTRNLQLTKSELWKKLKNWLNYMRENGREHPHFEITEVYHEKSLMCLFLTKERLVQVGELCKSAKELIKHEYCELIYKGFKALELRKTRPENDEFLAYIYDTSLKHITGLMDISGIQEITEINDTLCKNACVSPDFARQYKEQGKGKLYA